MIFRLFTAATIIYTTRLLRTNVYPLIKRDLCSCTIPVLFIPNENDRVTNSERETILDLLLFQFPIYIN